jgi:heme A synthase
VKQTYRALAGVIALGVIVQAAAIAFGWFDVISGLESGLVVDENFEPNTGHMLHGIVGMYVMPLLGLALLIVSFLAAKAVPGARMWAAILFVAILLQVVLAIVAFSAPVVGVLHGANALIIFGTAGRAAMLTRVTRAAGTASVPGAVPSQRTGTSSTGSSLPA